ncbi:hypothetical protein [Candidatus Uabimicrobium amorphum]|uniref:Adenylate kinase n=1 Tax=Uabimicrobium amorphum TaxID=2596890 RepID=A0A5S9IL67_UABAM|nr:hypothetical protein [Candidatus Uabimicrobium amorphum]BBM83903.1 hypothetical protein UABAM_02258 [Candidatus Uabimicrobium amorphum]
MNHRQIYFIGGAPTLGKSTLAQMLSQYLGIPWISTDQIRDIIRRATKYEELPKLFPPKDYDLERFFSEFSPQQIVQMEIEQGECAWPGIVDFIENDYTWTDGFVVEGVNVLPHLVHRSFSERTNVKTVFVKKSCSESIRKVIFERGICDTQSQKIKEKELEWVLLFDQKIQQLAVEYGFCLLEMNKNASDFSDLLRLFGFESLNRF